MEIKEVINDVKKAVGDKGLIAIVLGIVAVFLFVLFRQTKTEESNNLSYVTGVTSYPDAVTNADVIMDSVHDDIEYSENNIIDAINNNQMEINETIQGSTEQIIENANEKFEATNDYINKGFEAQKELSELHTNNIMSGIDGMENAIEANTAANKQLTNEVKKTAKTLSKGKTTTIKTTTAKKTGSSSTKGSTYTYKTKKGLNTSTSIVDALKAIGVNSSMASRKKIAKANGITNYTGTASQNITLLNKLKKGTLKKV